MRLIYLTDIVVVVACRLCVPSIPYPSRTSCRAIRVRVCCIRESRVHGYRRDISILQHTLSRTLLYGTPFKLGLIAKVGRVKSILLKNPKPPLVPLSYRCSSPFEVVPWAPFVLVASLLSPNNGYLSSPWLMSVRIFSPLLGYLVLPYMRCGIRPPSLCQSSRWRDPPAHRR